MRERGLLRDTRAVSVEEAVADVRNKTNSFRFHRSGETISRHFREVLLSRCWLSKCPRVFSTIPSSEISSKGRDPQNEKELYNKRHSQARNVIERTFGILKNQFAILKTATYACCVMHNFIRMHGSSNLAIDEEIVVNED
ncbi:putative nuclease HARBI1 [Cinnamomum micranthum f. kanehirae]|uniref:Putative nuclease HARBI1 n=1 Tax=Cinnamomum micranthum f. kanehirae TaxID=337451 RepID=A0A3S4NPV3_9MAGN|nr:putative nuclease HARBI1 [Cinnamomum micranthum f. kanehirae]